LQELTKAALTWRVRSRFSPRERQRSWFPLPGPMCILRPAKGCKEQRSAFSRCYARHNSRDDGERFRGPSQSGILTPNRLIQRSQRVVRVPRTIRKSIGGSKVLFTKFAARVMRGSWIGRTWGSTFRVVQPKLKRQHEHDGDNELQYGRFELTPLVTQVPWPLLIWGRAPKYSLVKRPEAAKLPASRVSSHHGKG